jgi:hypothetical protein
MNKNNQSGKSRLNISVGENVVEMADVLRTKHHLNISSIIREAVISWYNKLELKQETK